MTERPKTMMLSPHEWRALVGTTATNIYQYVSALTAERAPDATQVAWLHDTIDRLQMQVSAWSASGQPAAPVPEQPAMTEYLEQVASTNGTGAAAPSGPKKKRGWQKGRKRGPRKPRTDEAVQ